MRLKEKKRHKKHHYPPVQLRPDGVLEPEDAKERHAKYARLTPAEWKEMTVEQKLDFIAYYLGFLAPTG